MEGVPHLGCTVDADAVFDRAISAKLARYHGLGASRRCASVVLVAPTADRWHEDNMRLVRDLARLRASPDRLSWWSLPSSALHHSIAAALDPSLDVAAGTFPVASAIDIWVRDPQAADPLAAYSA